MSIRLVPQQQLIESKKQNGGVDETPLLFYPHLASLYDTRRQRFLQLAKDHPFGDYLNFAAVLTHAMDKTAKKYTLDQDYSEVVKQAEHAPLDCRTYQRDVIWQQMLLTLIDALLKDETLTPAIVNTLTALKETSSDDLEAMATSLLSQDLNTVHTDNALFIWAALSIYWAKMAHQVQQVSMAQVEAGEHRQYCPVCHSVPVASLVHLGTHSGTRYLHCSLCETEWYMARVKCTNCESQSNLSYLALDDEESVVKAECCDDCQSYLKILSQEKDPHLDVMADDLAALILSAKVEEEGYAYSGLNPYLFPGS